MNKLLRSNTTAILLFLAFAFAGFAFGQDTINSPLRVTVNYNSQPSKTKGFFISIRKNNNDLVNQFYHGESQELIINDLCPGSYKVLVVYKSCFSVEHNLIITEGNTTYLSVNLCSKKEVKKLK
ncbi:MAG TPA: hypothetical protein EYG86_01270, partial [Crocinitomicaceae bacterium]|nr:hypothetical protein [Crocinitomicaceae bacterium]